MEKCIFLFKTAYVAKKYVIEIMSVKKSSFKDQILTL